MRKIGYDSTSKKWILDIDGAGSEVFDKVVVATGINTIPNIPKLEGSELFQGDYIHSRSFKRYFISIHPLHDFIYAAHLMHPQTRTLQGQASASGRTRQHRR